MFSTICISATKKRNSPRSEEYKEIANVLYSIMNAAPANEE